MDKRADAGEFHESSELKSWPFVEAKRIIERIKINAKNVVTFETGYGPSGLPHIGTFGEVLRVTMVMNALRHLDPVIKCRLLAVSDDLDGLRKVPDNIPNREMVRQHLGKPLTSIPDPFGEKESYGAYMNAALCRLLDLYNFEYQFISSTEEYKNGTYDKQLLLALAHYDEIMALMLPTLGEDRQQTYSPFLPICPQTGKVLLVPVIRRDTVEGTITYLSEDNQEVTTKVTGGKCKLQWKPDWGMRWAAFAVDYENYGKDLIPSAALSEKICRVLGAEPPLLFCYELFLDEQGKKISKSKGNGLSMEDWLRYASPESLALYIYQNPKRAKKLYFGMIPQKVDEYLDLLVDYNQKPNYDSPVWHIHRGKVPFFTASKINFTLLLNLVGVALPTSLSDFNKSKQILWDFVQRYDQFLTPENSSIIDQLVGYAILYYQDFILPAKINYIPTQSERGAILAMIAALEGAAEQDSDALQSKAFTVGKENGYKNNLSEWFKLLYKVLFGQVEGPKIGSFIFIYGVEKTIILLKEAIEEGKTLN